MTSPSSSHQAAEVEGDLGLSKDEFGALNQVNQSKDPSGDFDNPDLTEADLLLVGTSFQVEMGFKRKPLTSLFNLIEGQPGNDAPGKSQSKLPPPPPQPQPAQIKSSSTQLQPSSPQSRLPPPFQSTLPPQPEPANSKRKRASKGKEPMDGGKSRSSREEDEALRASK